MLIRRSARGFSPFNITCYQIEPLAGDRSDPTSPSICLRYVRDIPFLSDLSDINY